MNTAAPTPTRQPHSGTDAPDALRSATAADTLVVLRVEYDGARYRGSQAQRPGTPTIQAEIEAALFRLTGRSCRITAAGRTDSGAHARGQVVSFPASSALPLDRYVTGLNHYLPDDISVTAAHRAPATFDVIRHARSRHYRYTIMNRRSRSALLSQQAAHVKEHLDDRAMSAAITALHGWLDVRPFCGPLAPDRNPLRRYDSAAVTRDGEIITIDLWASGFLPHQVRRVAGALVRVGSGQLSVSEFRRLAREGAPGEAPWTMPAAGLCLMSVEYDDGILSD